MAIEDGSEPDRLADLAALDHLIHWGTFCAHELRHCAEAGDISRIAQLTHQMRGDVSFNLDADVLVMQLGTLQAHARDRTMTTAHVQAVLDELARFLDEVRAQRDAKAARPLAFQGA